MKLSEKRKSAIYRAIHEAVLTARLGCEMRRKKSLPIEYDDAMANIPNVAYREVLKALGVKEMRNDT